MLFFCCRCVYSEPFVAGHDFLEIGKLARVPVIEFGAFASRARGFTGELLFIYVAFAGDQTSAGGCNRAES